MYLIKKIIILFLFLGSFSFTENLYKIQPEDEISVTVWPYSELSMNIKVRLDGRISYPIIGEIDVKGITPGELSKMIESALSEYVKNPRVAVNMLKYKMEKVFVFGEIKGPGSYSIIEGYTIVDVISQAGGTTERAKLDEIGLIKVKDKKPIIININLEKLLKEGKIEENVSLENGDIVFVPEKIEKKKKVKWSEIIDSLYKIGILFDVYKKNY